MAKPENSSDSNSVMAEAKRRMASFIPTNESNIALLPYESDDPDAPKEPALRLIFLNGSELDFSVDKLCDKLAEKDIVFYCEERVDGEAVRTKKQFNNRATLKGIPVNEYENEPPAIYLICSAEELAQKLPPSRRALDNS